MLGIAVRRSRNRVLAASSAILHIKGFATFYNKSSLELAKSRGLKFVKDFRPKVVVWDGDELSEASFTAIIPLLASEPELQEMEFYVFTSQGDLKAADRVEKWRTLLGSRLHWKVTKVAPVNGEFTEDDYVKHGYLTLLETQSMDVLVLGLGPCVAKEINLANIEIPQVRFHILDVWRDHPKNGLQNVSRFFPDGTPQNVSLVPMKIR